MRRLGRDIHAPLAQAERYALRPVPYGLRLLCRGTSNNARTREARGDKDYLPALAETALTWPDRTRVALPGWARQCSKVLYPFAPWVSPSSALHHLRKVFAAQRRGKHP